MANKKEEITAYDDINEFKEHCAPAIIEIKQFCLSRGIPFYMTFATANSNSGTTYSTAKQFPPECSVVLSDDKFKRLILAERGIDLNINNLDSFEMDEANITI